MEIRFYIFFIITELGCIPLNHGNKNFHPCCIISVGNNYLAVTYYVLPLHAFAACSHLSIMELRLKEKIGIQKRSLIVDYWNWI